MSFLIAAESLNSKYCIHGRAYSHSYDKSILYKLM